MTEEEQYWLLVEAQNYSSVISDTEDLSTIRGGSLLLRDSVHQADSVLKAQPGVTVTTATVGGSSGIWMIEGKEADARAAAGKVRRALSQDIYRHAGFALALTSAGKGTAYSSVRKQLKAIAAQQRFSQGRVAYPASEEGATGVCKVDFLRPVPKDGTLQKHPQEDYKVSLSVHERRRHGMDGKQTIIAKVTKDASSLPDHVRRQIADSAGRPFAFQIASISEGMAPPPGLRRNLHDKIAVIHLDGNGLGKVQKAALASDDTIRGQQDFDRQLQAALGEMIAKVLTLVIDEGGKGEPTTEEAVIRKDKEIAKEQVIRFEALLWGGDEIMFIVPARLGWKVAEAVAAMTDKLHIKTGADAEGNGGTQHPLNFAVGVVFCHHDAPITRIKALADDLANVAKQDAMTASGETVRGRDSTRFVPVVMESFDHSGGNTQDLLLKRAPGGHAGDAASYMTLSAVELGQLRTAAEALAGVGKATAPMSRGRLRLLARLVQTGAGHGVKKNEDVLEDAHGEAEAAGVSKLLDALDGKQFSGRFWRLLEEYWDYLVPIDPDKLRSAGGQS